ncbi:MAG: hypothetical protein UW11_C0031G0005 [Parcubacteria group bacterium GW2011_GWA2_43_9b]|nr:MAG: hypothetical protein UW11_C0031G0005 [Parcubacteria group bacterium GW2011_GWA2_43_9b]
MSGGRLAFVSEGGYGMVTQAEYDDIAESMVSSYQRLKKADTEEKIFTSVEVISSVEEAERKVRRGEINILVFLTRGQVQNARRIKTAYPYVKVAILTGLIPDDEIIWVSKAWQLETIRDIFINF